MIRTISSILLQLAVCACAAAGVILTTRLGGDFMAGATAFLFFTIQSNLWIAAVCLLFAVLQAVSLCRREFALPLACATLKYVFTVSITLTGAVFCAVLAPTMPGSFSSAANVLTHVAVPALAIGDLFLCRAPAPRYKDFWWALLPPLYYVGFAAVGYVCGWNFGMGNNYPYFFLNWGSPVGAFGFGGEGEYFMGCFWWILLLLLFISALALGYIAILRRMQKSGLQGLTPDPENRSNKSDTTRPPKHSKYNTPAAGNSRRGTEQISAPAARAGQQR